MKIDDVICGECGEVAVDDECRRLRRVTDANTRGAARQSKLPIIVDDLRGFFALLDGEGPAVGAAIVIPRFYCTFADGGPDKQQKAYDRYGAADQRTPRGKAGCKWLVRHGRNTPVAQMVIPLRRSSLLWNFNATPRYKASL